MLRATGRGVQWQALRSQRGKCVSTTPDPPESMLPLLTYIWDEYKYRHGLCWEAVYKVSAAVIALAVLPYVRPDLSKALGYWMLVPSVLGTLLAAFGIWVVNNELRLFAESKIAHYDLRMRIVYQSLTKDGQALIPETITAGKARWTLFDYFVHILMGVLLLLSLANTVFLGHSWIPHHRCSQPAVADQVECQLS